MMFYYSCAIICLAVGLFSIAERLWPAVPLPAVRGWWWRLGFLNMTSILVVGAIGYTWALLGVEWSIFHLRSTKTPIINGVLCYCLMSFINYWWHRARHENHRLWLWFHQIHHSPSRIQALTTYYRNPLDTLVQDTLACIFLFVVLGVGQDEVFVAATLTTVIEVYFHANIDVPRWTSYIIQSPLSHRIHHMRGEHFFNLGDIPILTDIPFGTFKNHNDGQPFDCGFEAHQERLLVEMMVNRDVQKVAPAAPQADLIRPTRPFSESPERRESANVEGPPGNPLP